MLDVWNLEVGDKLEQMPNGRVGTFVDFESTFHRLPCGCCDESGTTWVTLTWDDTGEEDDVDSEDLRLK